MELIIITIFLSLAIALFVMGHLVKDYLFSFMSATIFLLIALSIFTGGLEVKTGFTETQNLTLTNVSSIGDITTNYNYATNNSLYIDGIGTTLIGLSIYLYLVCWNMYKQNEEKNKGLLDD
jgi:hypothetical protein